MTHMFANDLLDRSIIVDVGLTILRGDKGSDSLLALRAWLCSILCAPSYLPQHTQITFSHQSTRHNTHKLSQDVSTIDYFHWSSKGFCHWTTNNSLPLDVRTAISRPRFRHVASANMANEWIFCITLSTHQDSELWLADSILCHTYTRMASVIHSRRAIAQDLIIIMTVNILSKFARISQKTVDSYWLDLD